jgi:ribosome production factor 2
LKADSIGISKRRAKTHKGRKIMENREAKIVEDLKNSIFIKGMKTSGMVMNLMKDLHAQR